jgi:hypothetical protein
MTTPILDLFAFAGCDVHHPSRRRTTGTGWLEKTMTPEDGPNWSEIRRPEV